MRSIGEIEWTIMVLGVGPDENLDRDFDFVRGILNNWVVEDQNARMN